MPIEIKRPEATVTFCADGDLYAEHAEAVAALQLERNRRMADPRLTDGPLAQAHLVQELEERMAATQYKFRLRGLPRKRWDELVAQFPPEKGTPDEQRGYNLAKLADAAMPESIVQVTVGDDERPVDFDPAKEWGPLVDEMTNSQWEDFQLGILNANRGRNEVPFSQAAWRETQS